MAYNYGFPMNYQPMQYAYNQQQQPQQQMSYAPPVQPQTSIIWVQGEAGAKAYPVAAGSNALLMDSESECFYIKSTDASGMPLPLRVFKYEEIVNTQPAIQQSHAALPDNQMYAKKEELEELRQQVNKLQSRTYREEMNDGE